MARRVCWRAVDDWPHLGESAMSIVNTGTLSAWIVDDDESIRWVLERALKSADIDVTTFPGGAELLDAIEENTRRWTASSHGL